jgi:hypothetical protein
VNIHVDILVGKSLETVLGVEHDDDAVDIVGKTFGDPALRRDLDGFADAIERGFMFSRQCLGSGDAGDASWSMGCAPPLAIAMRMVLW